MSSQQDHPSSKEISLWRSLPFSMRTRICCHSVLFWVSYGSGDRERWQTSKIIPHLSTNAIPLSGENIAMSSGLVSSLQIEVNRRSGSSSVRFTAYRYCDGESETLIAEVVADTIREAALLIVQEAIQGADCRRPPGSPLDRCVCALCATELSGGPDPLFCPFCQDSHENLQPITIRRFLEGESLPESRIEDRALRLSGLVSVALIESPIEIASLLVGE